MINKKFYIDYLSQQTKAYGRPSINEEKGWKLDHVIPFNFYHNAYIKSRAEQHRGGVHILLNNFKN